MAIFRFLALAALATLASASADVLVNQQSSASNLDAEFLNNEFAYFQTRYGKKYGHADEVARRRAIFEQNMKMINEHNNGANANGKTWFMAANEFTDLTSEEFAARVGLLKSLPANGRTRPVMSDIKSSNALPTEVDWTKEKAVSPVKNQGQCGSCWSFSAAGAIEGAWALKTGELLSVSEQQLVDCSRSYGEHGCRGGLMDGAFQYVIDHGICIEQDYPYESLEGVCKRCKSKVHVDSFVDVPRKNENALRTAISQRPVAVAVDADKFQFYSHGILNTCYKHPGVNHAVLAVGYSV
eukprot:Partr_v1_DN28450_c2_g2_i8_m41818 putative cathepsin